MGYKGRYRAALCFRPLQYCLYTDLIYHSPSQPVKYACHRADFSK